MNRLLWITGGAILLVLLTTISLWQRYEAFKTTALVVPAGGMVVAVKSGETAFTVLDRLETAGVTRFDWRWRLLLRLEPSTIHVGEFPLEPGLNPVGLLALLSSSTVVQYRFTIVEGWNYWQLRDALLNNERLRVDASLLDESVVMQSIGSNRQHPEGWFLPETYAYTAQDNAIDVLRRAHLAMSNLLPDVWSSRQADLPLTDPVDLLTLASIIEKESALNSEGPKIAGVFIRRLQQNWRLETDPTVIYGIGENFDGDIKRKDLRADTPYNTYVHRGLPPTPISMPGEDSLYAAAHPEEGEEMFFVANGKGGHEFSVTLEEHNRAVQALLKRQRAPRASKQSGGS